MEKVNNYILTYEQAYTIGADQIGPKSFNTARCHRDGYMVPHGVILPIQAFQVFLKGGNLEPLFSIIKDRFAHTDSLIVRSSALEEDSGNASFAGQYLSLICLNDAKEIKKACEACWSSFSSSSVNAYHKAMHRTVSHQKYGMGLLIQKMVNASTAGVCFTKDPVSAQKDIFIINAVHGQCEALVSGEVVADQYTFNIHDEKVVSQFTCHQSFWRSPEYPERLAPLLPELMNTPALSKVQIKEITRIAQKIVTLFGTPQDVEWAYEGNKLFLLQARPITAKKEKEKYELWTRDNVADVIPDAITPLTWSIVKDATNNGFEHVIQALGRSDITATLFSVFDGRVYMNQTAYQKLLTGHKKEKQNPIFLLKTGINYLRLLSSLKKKVTGLENNFWKGLNELSASDHKSSIKGLKDYLETYMAIHFRITILASLGFTMIHKIIRKYIPNDQVNAIVDELVTGLHEIESTNLGEALWELACLVKNNKELAEMILNSQDRSIPDILRTWGGVYEKKWQQILDHYGYLSLNEFEIYYPRWVEDHGVMVATLKQYILNGENIDLKKNKSNRAEKRMESEERLLKSIPLQYKLPIAFYIKHVRQCSIWRESMKQKLVRIMAEIRKQVLLFADNKKVTPLENVFFLKLDEIFQSKENAVSLELLEEITTRKKNWEIWKKQKAFKEIRVYADEHKIKVPHLSGSDNFQGLSLSSGKYAGPAKIILDPSKIDSFNKGDILVTHSTNPSWSPIFTLAGAIVTDMGNYLSHGAIVARELGIPAVGNLFDATKRIKNGQFIFVDGDSGIISLK